MIEVPAELSRLAEFTGAARRFAAAAGLPERRLNDIELAVEEIFANICEHGPAGTSARLECLDDGDSLVFEISDDAPPFDPLSRPDPDLDAPLEEREIGGLGIFLVKKLMDDVRYERRGNGNSLRLVVRKRPVVEDGRD
jgi:serine/threonine-protein kinase RsbW